MKGYIKQLDGLYIVRVEGYSTIKFMYYTKKEAIARYRERYGLERKHINFVEN